MRARRTGVLTASYESPSQESPSTLCRNRPRRGRRRGERRPKTTSGRAETGGDSVARGRRVPRVDVRRPAAVEGDARRARRLADLLRVRGLELADHPLAVLGQVAPHPARAVRLQALVQAPGAVAEVLLADRAIERLLENEYGHVAFVALAQLREHPSE